MKKVALTLLVLLLLGVMIGADIERKITTTQPAPAFKKKPCYGYTILEFGKGIDCNGNVIALKKVKGIQVRY